jgi:hypothetical protein
MHVTPIAVCTLEGAGLLRALHHARDCDTCRVPVERALLATRCLEGGSPWKPTEAECDAHIDAGLVAALRSARPPRRWPTFAGLGVALAAAASLIVVVNRPPEFTARGAGEGRAVLRMFCASAGDAGLRELASGASCPSGAKLAFAAAGAPGLSSVALRLSGSSGVQLLGVFPVTGQPGAEAPLETTPALSGAGTMEVTAAFASTPEAAQAALRGEQASGAVVLRQRIQVEGGR